MAVYNYDSQNQELHRIAGGTVYADCPIGSYIPFGGTVIPTGWLLCNGQAVSRTDYADLFAVIGTAYGSGDGSTTFNIPDLRESVPKGAGLTGLSNNYLDADGLAVGEFLDDRLQDHRHTLPLGSSSGGNAVMLAEKTLDDNTGFIESGYRTGATTEVKSVGSNYIIKAKQIGVPADFVSEISKQLNWTYLGYLNGDPQYTTMTLDSKYHEFMLEVQNASSNIFSAVYSATRETIGNVTQYLCVGNDSTIAIYVTSTRTLTFYRTASSNIRVYAR